MGFPTQRSAVAVALVATLLAFCGQNVVGQDETNLPGVLSKSSYSTFAGYIDQAQLTPLLLDEASKNTTITVFAPRNSYLSGHVDPKVIAYLADPTNLADFQQVLKFHFVFQAVPLEAAAVQTFPSASGDILTVKYDAGTARYTVEADTPLKRPNAITIDSPPAVVHGIDGLLIPPSVYAKLVAAGIVGGASGPSPAVVPPAAGPSLAPTVPVIPTPTGPSLAPTVPVIPPPTGPSLAPTVPLIPPPTGPSLAPGGVPIPPTDAPPAGPGGAPEGPTSGPTSAPPGGVPILPPPGTPGGPAPGPAPEVVVAVGDKLLAALDDGKHEQFKAALAASGTTDEIKGFKTPTTILAPSDSAFAALDKLTPAQKEALNAPNSPLMKQVLDNHIIVGDYSAATLAAKAPVKVTTLAGEEVTVKKDAAGHLVVEQANSAKVTKELLSDPSAGAVHDIDTILLSPSVLAQLSAVGGPAPAPSPYGSNGIIDALNKDGNYGTLVGAIGDANLTDTVAGYTGDVTVLAPTDAAFKNADPEVKKALENPELKKKILQHHIIPAYLTPALLAASAPIAYKSLEGSNITVTKPDDDLTFSGSAKALSPPVKQSGNSAVIGIDKVIIPDDLKTEVYGATGASAPPPSSGDGKKKKGTKGCGAVCVGVICGILGAIALLICCWAVFAAGSRRKRDDESGDKLPGEADAPRARRLTI